MTLRALSLWQPWASLCFDGEGPDGTTGVKVHETRTWAPPRSVIGHTLAIHAAQHRVRDEELPFGLRELLRRVYGCEGMPRLPYGALIGTVRLVGVRRMPSATPASEEDRVAGNWEPGRFAWEFADARALREPRPMRGFQGLWILGTTVLESDLRVRAASGEARA